MENHGEWIRETKCHWVMQLRREGLIEFKRRGRPSTRTLLIAFEELFEPRVALEDITPLLESKSGLNSQCLSDVDDIGSDDNTSGGEDDEKDDSSLSEQDAVSHELEPCSNGREDDNNVQLVGRTVEHSSKSVDIAAILKDSKPPKKSILNLDPEKPNLHFRTRIDKTKCKFLGLKPHARPTLKRESGGTSARRSVEGFVKSIPSKRLAAAFDAWFRQRWMTSKPSLHEKKKNSRTPEPHKAGCKLANETKDTELFQLETYSEPSVNASARTSNNESIHPTAIVQNRYRSSPLWDHFTSVQDTPFEPESNGNVADADSDEFGFCHGNAALDKREQLVKQAHKDTDEETFAGASKDLPHSTISNASVSVEDSITTRVCDIQNLEFQPSYPEGNDDSDNCDAHLSGAMDLSSSSSKQFNVCSITCQNISENSPNKTGANNDQWSTLADAAVDESCEPSCQNSVVPERHCLSASIGGSPVQTIAQRREEVLDTQAEEKPIAHLHDSPEMISSPMNEINQIGTYASHSYSTKEPDCEVHGEQKECTLNASDVGQVGAFDCDADNVVEDLSKVSQQEHLDINNGEPTGTLLCNSIDLDANDELKLAPLSDNVHAITTNHPSGNVPAEERGKAIVAQVEGDVTSTPFLDCDVSDATFKEEYVKDNLDSTTPQAEGLSEQVLTNDRGSPHLEDKKNRATCQEKSWMMTISPEDSQTASSEDPLEQSADEMLGCNLVIAGDKSAELDDPGQLLSSTMSDHTGPTIRPERIPSCDALHTTVVSPKEGKEDAPQEQGACLPNDAEANGCGGNEIGSGPPSEDPYQQRSPHHDGEPVLKINWVDPGIKSPEVTEDSDRADVREDSDRAETPHPDISEELPGGECVTPKLSEQGERKKSMSKQWNPRLVPARFAARKYPPRKRRCQEHQQSKVVKKVRVGDSDVSAEANDITRRLSCEFSKHNWLERKIQEKFGTLADDPISGSDKPLPSSEHDHALHTKVSKKEFTKAIELCQKKSKTSSSNKSLVKVKLSKKAMNELQADICVASSLRYRRVQKTLKDKSKVLARCKRNYASQKRVVRKKRKTMKAQKEQQMTPSESQKHCFATVAGGLSEENGCDVMSPQDEYMPRLIEDVLPDSDFTEVSNECDEPLLPSYDSDVPNTSEISADIDFGSQDNTLENTAVEANNNMKITSDEDNTCSLKIVEVRSLADDMAHSIDQQKLPLPDEYSSPSSLDLALPKSTDVCPFSEATVKEEPHSPVNMKCTTLKSEHILEIKPISCPAKEECTNGDKGISNEGLCTFCNPALLKDIPMEREQNISTPQNTVKKVEDVPLDLSKASTFGLPIDANSGALDLRKTPTPIGLETVKYAAIRASLEAKPGTRSPLTHQNLRPGEPQGHLPSSKVPPHLNNLPLKPLDSGTSNHVSTSVEGTTNRQSDVICLGFSKGSQESLPCPSTETAVNGEQKNASAFKVPNTVPVTSKRRYRRRIPNPVPRFMMNHVNPLLSGDRGTNFVHHVDLTSDGPEAPTPKQLLPQVQFPLNHPVAAAAAGMYAASSRRQADANSTGVYQPFHPAFATRFPGMRPSHYKGMTQWQSLPFSSEPSAENINKIHANTRGEVHPSANFPKQNPSNGMPPYPAFNPDLVRRMATAPLHINNHASHSAANQGQVPTGGPRFQGYQTGDRPSGTVTATSNGAGLWQQTSPSTARQGQFQGHRSMYENGSYATSAPKPPPYTHSQGAQIIPPRGHAAPTVTEKYPPSSYGIPQPAAAQSQIAPVSRWATHPGRQQPEQSATVTSPVTRQVLPGARSDRYWKDPPPYPGTSRQVTPGGIAEKAMDGMVHTQTREHKDRNLNPRNKTNIFCHTCGQKAKFQCSGCRKVGYCGRECQTKGWPGHRQECQRSTRLIH